MTFEDLAKKMEKERSVVYKTICNGNPTLNFLVKLSEALGLTIDTIISPAKKTNDFISHDENDIIDGFVEVNGTTYRIHEKIDIDNLYTHLRKQ